MHVNVTKRMGGGLGLLFLLDETPSSSMDSLLRVVVLVFKIKALPFISLLQSSIHQLSK